MPGGNRRGPANQGPMTGRGFGYCAGHNAPGYVAGGRGYGYGMGAQHRHGWGGWHGAGGGPWWGAPAHYGTWAPPHPSREDELAFLREQAQAFKETLDDIDKRIQDLERAPGNEKQSSTAL